jgi:hypothetical protein
VGIKITVQRYTKIRCVKFREIEWWIQEVQWGWGSCVSLHSLRTLTRVPRTIHGSPRIVVQLQTSAFAFSNLLWFDQYKCGYASGTFMTESGGRGGGGPHERDYWLKIQKNPHKTYNF